MTEKIMRRHEVMIMVEANKASHVAQYVIPFVTSWNQHGLFQVTLGLVSQKPADVFPLLPWGQMHIIPIIKPHRSRFQDLFDAAGWAEIGKWTITAEQSFKPNAIGFDFESLLVHAYPVKSVVDTDQGIDWPELWHNIDRLETLAENCKTNLPTIIYPAYSTIDKILGLRQRVFAQAVRANVCTCYMTNFRFGTRGYRAIHETWRDQIARWHSNQHAIGVDMMWTQGEGFNLEKVIDNMIISGKTAKEIVEAIEELAPFDDPAPKYWLDTELAAMLQADSLPFTNKVIWYPSAQRLTGVPLRLKAVFGDRELPFTKWQVREIDEDQT